MLYIVLVSILLVTSLIGYLAYSKIKDYLRFADLKFTEVSYVSEFIGKFEPKGPSSRLTKDILFILFNDFTIKQFTLARIIYTVMAFIFTVTMSYTVFLSSKSNVFQEYRHLPFLVSERDYLVLNSELSYQDIDYMRDINVLSKNILSTTDASRYLNSSPNLVYQTVAEINEELSGSFIMFPLILSVVIFAILFYMPNFLLKMSLGLIRDSTDMEFFKLESYIYLNCDHSIEELLEDLEGQSVVFKKLFRFTLLKYRESPDDTYRLIFNHVGINRMFKILIEYLNKLEEVSPDIVRKEIAINQEANLVAIERKLLAVREKRLRLCNALSVGALFVALGGIIVAMLLGVDISGLDLGGF